MPCCVLAALGRPLLPQVRARRLRVSEITGPKLITSRPATQAGAAEGQTRHLASGGLGQVARVSRLRPVLVRAF